MRFPLRLFLRPGRLRGASPYVLGVVPPSGGAPAAPAPAGAIRKGFTPAPLQEGPPSSVPESASKRWVTRVVEVVNEVQRGKMNVVLQATLTANSTTTDIIDNRVGAFSSILFSPVTANAAAEMAAGTLFVSMQKQGEAVLTHASNAQEDRTFNLAIIG